MNLPLLAATRSTTSSSRGWKTQVCPPRPPADRYTLVRRLYLDLIGLPPTPAEADAFVKTVPRRL